MNIGYEENELVPYVDPEPDLNDSFRQRERHPPSLLPNSSPRVHACLHHVLDSNWSLPLSYCRFTVCMYTMVLTLIGARHPPSPCREDADDGLHYEGDPGVAG